MTYMKKIKEFSKTILKYLLIANLYNVVKKISKKKFILNQKKKYLGKSQTSISKKTKYYN